jgi:exosortase
VNTLELTTVLERGGASKWGRLGVAGGAILLLYLPIFPALAQDWLAFPNLSHGFAIPFIAAYLVWIRRDAISRLPEAPSWAGLPVTLLGLATYVVGIRGGEMFLARMSLPVTLFGAVLFLSGRAVTKRLVVGIAYLLFMMPLPYVTLHSLTNTMRLVDASATAAVLPWLGVPVFQQGYFLELPRITLEVADVCSSIPAISALVATGAAYGFVSVRPMPIRILLVITAVPLGILSNIVRIILTAAGAYYIGPIVLHSVLHMWNGTVVFVMTLGALVVMDTALLRVWRLR